MGYRKATIRRTRPLTRRLARLINDQESIVTRTKNLLMEIAVIEGDSEALRYQSKNYKHTDSYSGEIQVMYPWDDEDGGSDGRDWA